MLIREATSGDIASIVRLERLPEFHTFIGKWPAEKHARVLAEEDSVYLVVEDATGVVAGFAILLGVTSEDKSIELKRLAIETSGQGTGSKLLRFILAKVFNEYRAHRLYLDVDETNPRAKRVYEKLGFKEDGVLREATCCDGKFYSMTLMSLLDREYCAMQNNGA